MKVFLDTEFNGFGRELISMALVTEMGNEFYEVCPLPEYGWDKWVFENVYPVLNQSPVTAQQFTHRLEAFLRTYCNGATIIADWPADFQYLCEQMAIIGKNCLFNMPIECRMELIVSGEIRPTTPHNALSDARALKAWYLTHRTPQV